jgi:hypothetical protein
MNQRDHEPTPARSLKEAPMNEDALNMSTRKFLKTLGVTSQREIEKAVRAAAEAGTLPPGPLAATARVSVAGIACDITINGKLDVD